jgi:ribosomal protein S18 acetylase RimI-like enzyme
MSEPAIRDATAADRDALIELVIAEGFESEGRELDRTKVARGVDAALADPGLARYWIAEQDGRVVGAIASTREWSDWHGSAYWWIQFVYVAPDLRGTGLVDALMTAVEKAARADGAFDVRLLVHPHNTRAVRAYEKLGFVAAPYLMMRRPL